LYIYLSNPALANLNILIPDRILSSLFNKRAIALLRQQQSFPRFGKPHSTKQLPKC
jgi:hypothetical protein